VALVGLGIILAVAGVIAIYAAFQPILRANLAAPTPVSPLSESVVIAARDIPLGALLSEADLGTAQVPVQLIPRNAVSEIQNAVGRYTQASLVEGQMILGHQLADPTNETHDTAFTLADDQVLMAFHPNDLISELAIVERGDIVDIFVSASVSTDVLNSEGEPVPGAESQTTLFTFDALQAVRVTAMIASIIPPEEGSNSSPQISVQGYLLALNPQDALLLKHLRDSGGIFDLVLRAPTSSATFGLNAVSKQTLIDRFGLYISQ
jgi:pilus assembly protein CpaB